MRRRETGACPAEATVGVIGGPDRTPRETLCRHLAGRGLSRERVLACAARLLDLGFFRIGTEGYAEENQTYGLATMHKGHVKLEPPSTVTFDYMAKGSKRRIQSVVDPDVYAVVEALKRRRGGKPELLAWRRGREWVDVRSADINLYIKEVTGGEFTAKDFRTWNATVLAAVALAEQQPRLHPHAVAQCLCGHGSGNDRRLAGDARSVRQASALDLARAGDNFVAKMTTALDSCDRMLALFVAQGRVNLRVRFLEAGDQNVIVDDVRPYRERKVRLLNGAHSAMAPIGPPIPPWAGGTSTATSRPCWPCSPSSATPTSPRPHLVPGLDREAVMPPRGAA